MFVNLSGVRLRQPYERDRYHSPIGFSYLTFGFQMRPLILS